MKVNNRQAVRETAWTIYKAEKKRNLLSVSAICMASFLITVMAALGSSYWNTLTQRQMRMQGIDYDIELGEPESDQAKAVRAMEKVKYAGLTVACASVSQYKDQAVDYAKLYWADEICWEKQIVPALETYHGHYPVKKNELMLSETLLHAMHIKQIQTGMKLPLSYSVMAQHDTDTPLHQEFVLCGWYQDYSGTEKGYVSKAFYDSTGVQQTDFGLGSLKISLVNPLYSAEDIADINQAAGIKDTQHITADDYAIPHFCQVMLTLAGLFLMILISAYLFIYNTMYISISRNIRCYGQLKTIGMTSVQLKSIVYRQAFYNAAAGILSGLALAVLISKTAVPKILLMVNGASDESLIAPIRPWVYLAAGLFCLFVNFTSCAKPAKIAGSCSPVEAMRFLSGTARAFRADTGLMACNALRRLDKDKTAACPQCVPATAASSPVPDSCDSRKTADELIFRASDTGNRLPHSRRKTPLPAMAAQNIFRDKKQSSVIILSFITALSVFFTVNVAVLGNNAKHILNTASTYDIQFINQTMLKKQKQIFTKEKIEALKAIEGVKTVRQVTSAIADIPYQEDVFGEFYRAFYASRYSPGNYEDDMAKYKSNADPAWSQTFFGTRLAGIDEAGFERLNESTGNILNKEAFENGKTAVALEMPFAPGSFHMAGKTVRFLTPEGRFPYKEYSLQIAAVSRETINYFAGGCTPFLVVSESFLQKILGETYTELIEIDYREPYSQETEEAVKAVFADEKNVTFTSKYDRYLSMLDTESKMKLLGYSIGFMTAVLAFLNYINMTAASVQNRQMEFAILESIGMTKKQLYAMLCIEGAGYGILSAACSLFTGTAVSYALFDGLTAYSLPFTIPLESTLVMYAAAAVLCTAAPVVIFRLSQNAGLSLTERLVKFRE